MRRACDHARAKSIPILDGHPQPRHERARVLAEPLLSRHEGPSFGLDHLLTEQEASTEEIEAVRHWLTREGTSFLHPAVARWLTLLCALSTAQHVPPHERNPMEESRSLRDGSQERPPVPAR